MNNCIIINGQTIGLTEEQVKKIAAAYNASSVKLSDIPAEETCKIGEHEFIVLEHAGDTTLLVRKDPLPDDIAFGENNNYNGSNVDAVCIAFGDEIAAIVGAENIVPHTVDLTANDGLDDYGEIERFASAFTADRQRRYVRTMDKYPTDRWCWLATPWSTPTHENDKYVLCVSPSGLITFNLYYDNGDCGVRPFCILKSNIFVSK